MGFVLLVIYVISLVCGANPPLWLFFIGLILWLVERE